MDFDQRIGNHSLASTGSAPFLDREGRDVLVVIARVAYRLQPNGEPRYTSAPVRFSDVSDEGGGVLRPSDLADEKPGTDVGVVGTALPRPGAPVPRALAWVQAGTLRAAVQLVGPRTYQARRGAAEPGPPAPLGPTPLRWDHAFGGVDTTDSEAPAEHGDNPIGRGFARHPMNRLGRPAPQLEPADGEDPERAVGFAPVPESWESRRKRFGTLDARWASERAPVWPKDADARRYCWSAPGLWSATPLAPDVPFELGGVTTGGVLRFTLPRYAVAFESKLRGDTRQHPTHLDGVLLDLDNATVELTWRTSIGLPRKWEWLEAIEVSGVGKIPRRVLGDPPETWNDDAA